MGLYRRLHTKFFVKSGFEYAAFLKKNSILHSQGDNCFISKAANIPDPYLTALGDNVWITSGCQLLCHDASVIMINVMKNSALDRVGPIRIADNCFLGNNVIVLPGTIIEPNTIVGAGSVVTSELKGSAVYAGTPARMICSFEEYVQKAENETRRYPWADLLKIVSRHVYDPVLEKKLRVKRISHFFGRTD